MKRYRILQFYLDTNRNFAPEKEFAKTAVGKAALESAGSIAYNFGALQLSQKVERYYEIDPPDISIPTEYTKLMVEVGDAYIHGQFYPALTGACALGERILNILILKLRTHFKSTPGYKKVYRKKSFQDWDWCIETLTDWEIFNEKIAEKFRLLKDKRHRSIHFTPEMDWQKEALESLNTIHSITSSLFRTWRNEFCFCIRGEIYIGKAFEDHPLVKEFYLSACEKVGFKHIRENQYLVDNFEYEDKEITDEEFVEQREACLNRVKKF
ncbi:hypothetical protein HQ587_03115 [bacterium]|nr:hypothetical protein [bacterium]